MLVLSPGPYLVQSQVARVRASLPEWRRMGVSADVMRILAHGLQLPLPMDARKRLAGSAFGTSRVPLESPQGQWLWRTIQAKVACGAWADLSGTPLDTICLCPLFVLPRPGPNEWRDIWDLRPVNAEFEAPSFRYETLETLRRMLGRNWWFATLDLQEAYHHIGLHPTDMPFVAFRWQGLTIGSLVIPYGLSLSPRTFTKVLRTLIAHWRGLNVLVIAYLDDLIVMAPTRDGLLASMSRVRSDVEAAGFGVNEKKSRWVPAQQGEWLGVQIDTVAGTFAITERQLLKLEAELKSFLHETSAEPVVRARAIAKLAGRIVCWQRCFPPAKLITRELYACLSNQRNFNMSVTVSPTALKDMEWLLDNLRRWNGKSIWRPSRVQVVTTDVSDTHWCGHRLEQLLSRGLLSESEVEESSTFRELVAFLRYLEETLHLLRDKAIQWRSDNTGAVADVWKQGAGNGKLWAVVRQIWQLMMENNIELTEVRWIPREQNVLANWGSKRSADKGDWCVSNHAFKLAAQRWGQCVVDRFASRDNHKLPAYNSRWFEREAAAVDAFTEDWSSGLNWLAPPFAMIAWCLQHLRECSAEAVLVVPRWPAQPWWPLLQLLQPNPKDVIELGSEHFVSGPSGLCEPHANPATVMLLVRVSGRAFVELALPPCVGTPQT